MSIIPTSGGGYIMPPTPPIMYPPGGGYVPPGSPSYSPPSSGGGCPGCSGSSSTGFSTSNNPSQQMNNQVQSWYDLPVQQPVDPRILIANCLIDSTQGAFARSTLYTAATWGTSPLLLSGSVLCTTLHTDDALAVAEAAQWTFSHQGLNMAVTNPPALQKVMFLRGGTSYQLAFDIDFGGSNHTAVMLSFRDNAATPGDFASGGGTIPVILIPGTYTGIRSFKVTLKMLGSFSMGLRTTVGANNYLFEMEWNVVQ